ncbi:hypothetical protein TVAG_078050 [Trichomonas vaginalis G3]|uniref:Saposin B-type domain-containing protein n=1 Tax=Trichomonas vaginalis (strain ATCC PRA-98 / G3) TaxID=412133 RepID=A2FIA8_TRIV3|nr:saposin family [Trichomonas vaginalis G3]EAX95349.1 hypothetical protein TVAG_078050 [Trichomonas vaginalis G3]KAI5521014.1 saposin family [Trichomonas vaginalis G3]|eukprot:XP_001308279.1 hypothetical protein [Trichomonas vaginalis G3]
MFKEDSSKFAQPDVNLFLKICKLVPMFQDMCHLITEEKVARVYDYIASNEDPREVCITYGVC